MIQNRWDPSTPYVGVLKMHQTLVPGRGSSRSSAAAHSSCLGTGNSCGNLVVTRCHTTGERSARDASYPDWEVRGPGILVPSRSSRCFRSSTKAGSAW